MAACETVEEFPVVMLYDHLSSVGAAMDTFTHLTHELEADFKPELKVWRMDDAASPEFSARANADFAAAEVIIVTVRGNQPWPEAFLQWKEGAGEGIASGSPHAIVALIEAGDDGPSSATVSWNSVLRSAATQIHPEVFVYESKANPDVCSTLPIPGFSAFTDECREKVPLG